MSYVFLLLFVAAVVGIFKPYIQNSKRWHFAIAAVVSFFLVGIFAPSTVPNGKKVPARVNEAQSDSTSDANGNLAASQPEATSKWLYSQSRDEMRGTTTKFASIESENEEDLEFPYGKIHGQLWIRRRPEDGLNVAFEVYQGQVLCHSYSDNHVSMKFDNGPIQKFRCTGSSDGSTETAFIENEGRVLAALKRAKRVVVEAEFYQQGRQLFVFDVAGLKWE